MNGNFLKVAKQAALEAGKVIQKYSGQNVKKDIKEGDKSNFVTKVDLESEKVIVKILSSHFPSHSIITEEGGGRDKKSDYIWMIDPLDGTFTFSQHIPYFTVSIGLLKNKQPILGVINHVSLKNIYWAQKDKGAFLNDKEIKVSNKKELEEVAGTLELGHRQKRQIRLDSYINRLVTKIGYAYQFGSSAVTLALVAEGLLDLYVSQAYPWDFVAGAVIVREAGGTVTDFEGKEPDWTKERINLVASNGLIHERILEALR